MKQLILPFALGEKVKVRCNGKTAIVRGYCFKHGYLGLTDDAKYEYAFGIWTDRGLYDVRELIPFRFPKESYIDKHAV